MTVDDNIRAGTTDDHASGTAASPQPESNLTLGRAVRLLVLVALIVLLGVTQGVSMLIVVAAIVVMIFLHELGHFVMARRAGMLATEFFIGFGPRIFSFKRGETEYGLKAIPAGAYVKIIGMSSMEEVDPALESRTYRQKSFWQRMGVAVAGSTMHFILALLLLMGQAMFIGTADSERWTIGDITPGSAAQTAGLRTGDEITEFNGRRVSSFDEFRSELSGIEPGRVDLTIVRDGRRMNVPIDLSTRSKLIGTIGEDVDIVDSGHGLILGDPYLDGQAERAGVVGGSTLLAVNGSEVDSLLQVSEAVKSAQSGRVTLRTSDPSGKVSEHTFNLGSAIATTTPTAFVGVGENLYLTRHWPPRAGWYALKTFGQVTGASIKGIGQFIWPPNLVRFVSDTVSGADVADRTDKPTPAESTPLGADAHRPISIIGVALLGSDLSAQNMASLVEFLALINIFFGVFNLIPILPFDGGHVAIAIYEKVREARSGSRQRYLSDVSKMAPIVYAVVGVLVVVGLLAMFLDITRGVNL